MEYDLYRIQLRLHYNLNHNCTTQLFRRVSELGQIVGHRKLRKRQREKCGYYIGITRMITRQSFFAT